MKKLISICIFALLHSSLAPASDHCMLIPLTLESRIQNSSLIVEGKIISQEAFKNTTGRNIYTASILEIYGVMKGRISTATVEVITEGGVMGNEMMWYTSLLQLHTGQQGVFFLQPATGQLIDVANHKKAYVVYSSAQGFFEYDAAVKNATDPFLTMPVDQLKSRIVRVHGPADVRLIKKAETLLPTQNKITAIISTFSPSTVVAGNRSVLTINGSGFGNTRGNGSVEFDAANSTAADFRQALPTDYLSWTDTQIRLFVPGLTIINNDMGTLSNNPAGTGFFRVRDNGGGLVQSATTLTVSYSFFNNIVDTANVIDQVDMDGNGGYTFNYNIDFANTGGATASFERALNQWKCNTGVNWTISPQTTATNIRGNDGVNLIHFGTLTPGVAGFGGGHLTACASAGKFFFIVDDLDITFSTDASGNGWSFGPGLPPSGDIDFETVALHESGHMLMINHSNEAAAVMFPSLSAGVAKRVLQANDIAAGVEEMTRSLVANACGPAPATLYQPVAGTCVISTPTTNVCANAIIGFTAVVSGANGLVNFQWKKNGVNVGSNLPTLSQLGLADNDVITCVISVCSATATSNALTMDVTTLPPNAGTITGPSCINAPSTATYSIAPISGATSYVWTIPAGATFTGASNGTAVTVNFPANFTSGSVTVRGVNNCGNSPSAASLTVRVIPAAPGAISGTSINVCGTTKAYSIAAVPNATSYQWIAPIGATIIGSFTSTNVNISFSGSYPPGDISVAAINNTCTSSSSLLSVSGSPTTPAGIICPSMYPVSTNMPCSVQVVNNASSYTWSTTGGGGSVVSGQGNDTAVVRFITAGNKQVCARAVNGCGSSAIRCRAVTIVNYRETFSDSGQNHFIANIFPNPVAEDLHLEIANFDDAMDLEVTIHDMAGRIVLTHSLQVTSDSNERTLNIAALTKGMYVARIQSSVHTETIRFVKL